MFRKIMVPVDLAHTEAITPALTAAADLARHYGAEVCYVGVTATTPGSVARTPEEYAHKLQAFAEDQKSEHGQAVSSHCITSPDPVADLDDTLIHAIDEVGADLVVMATHLPRHLDAVMPAHGGKIATHTDVSVFLVRPPAGQA
ncbi:universal stress protein [Spiribacter halobius]|uniref:Universal stress protein UspA n=1 Tax=Sediminicurvatus halobius TaxID=2182432 RepID=A0A2U2N3P9_9GAMM|nr:universal stress protein [Spiribacter halobius]PWG63712.1 universal stress protein UspA [Spiribacter halobius]UEX79850.1 universal stress protein [Spiribacter halobius]